MKSEDNNIMKNVIFIIYFSPPYDVYKTLPEENSWITENGNVVHIFGYDFGDLLLKALTDYYSNYNCEIWQPDLIADKIYTAQFNERLVHRNFPAKKIKIFNKFKFCKDVYSKYLLEYIKKYDNKENIFMISSSNYLNGRKIAKYIKKANKLYYCFFNLQLLLPDKIETNNPLKIVNSWIKNHNKIRWLKQVKNLLTGDNNPEALTNLKKIISDINYFIFDFGIDCDFWGPVIEKSEARKILGIPQESFVILLSQRLVPVYQVDKFIECLSKVNAERDYKCYITGHGTLEYETYLKELVIKYDLQHIVNFVGYVEDNVLRYYFISADLFVTVPYISAGSYSAAKAMCIGVPIFHSTTGDSYEFLKKHNAGEFVSPCDYDEWTEKLEDIINGKIKVKTVPREEVVNYYSWKRTADDLHYALMNLK